MSFRATAFTVIDKLQIVYVPNKNLMYDRSCIYEFECYSCSGHVNRLIRSHDLLVLLLGLNLLLAYPIHKSDWKLCRVRKTYTSKPNRQERFPILPYAVICPYYSLSFSYVLAYSHSLLWPLHPRSSTDLWRSSAVYRTSNRASRRKYWHLHPRHSSCCQWRRTWEAAVKLVQRS